MTDTITLSRAPALAAPLPLTAAVPALAVSTVGTVRLTTTPGLLTTLRTATLPTFLVGTALVSVVSVTGFCHGIPPIHIPIIIGMYSYTPPFPLSRGKFLTAAVRASLRIADKWVRTKDSAIADNLVSTKHSAVADNLVSTNSSTVAGFLGVQYEIVGGF